MRKLLALIVGVVLFATPALAGWNIRQNADGTADWVNTRGDTSPIGAIYLNATITDIATAQTIAVVIPVTAVKVTYIQSVIDGTITTNTNSIDFWRSIDLSGTVVDEISNAVTKMSVLSESTVGTVDTFTPTVNNTLQKNGVLYIHTVGEATTTGQVAVHFTITLQPYR